MIYRWGASPMAPSRLLAGKMISRFLTGVIQMGLLFTFGRLALGISLGPSLTALALVTLGITFSSAVFGLPAAALAPTCDSVLPMGTIAIVAMAAVGGCWWPITIEPPWLQRAADVFPTAWAMEAFNDLMLRERDLADVLPAVGALVGFGSLYWLTGRYVYRAQEESG